MAPEVTIGPAFTITVNTERATKATLHAALCIVEGIGHRAFFAFLGNIQYMTVGEYERVIWH